MLPRIQKNNLNNPQVEEVTRKSDILHCTGQGEDLITWVTGEPVCCIFDTNINRVSMILQ